MLVATGGALVVANCVVSGNSASGGAGGDGSSGANTNGSMGNIGGGGGGGGSAGGGAISNSGTLIVVGATFFGNSATGGAGGSGGHGGNATGAPGGKGGNAGVGAAGSGGALLNSGTLIVANATFTANTASGGAGGNGGVGGSGTGNGANGNGANGGNGAGGAIDHGGSGTFAATNATIARNSASGGPLGTGGAGNGTNGIGIGDAIRNGGGGVSFTNTLLATSGAGNGNCGGNPVGDGGYNLDFAAAATCQFSNHAQTGDPGLGTLANHGGPTPTLDIGPGGSAAGLGNITACAGTPVNGVDQRGLNRPANRCSIGAVEPQPAPFPTLSAISSSAGGLAGGIPVALTGTGFVTGATVTFGGAAVTAITNANATTLTVTTPAHAIGTVDVVVTNPDRQAATLSAAYTFSVVATLPGTRPPGSSGGVPGPLPTARPPGPSPSGIPNPLPPRR